MSDRIQMWDTFLMDDVHRSPDGYISANARVARTGIQVYKGAEVGRPDLDTVRVYRPPSEVFKKDAMRSFAHRPITFTHPKETVHSRNWRKYAVGHTGDEVIRDGEFIRVPMVLMDQAAIDKYQNEGIRELSMGYSTDLKWRNGRTEDGESYDAVQTGIKANHLAVVPVARGGENLRIGDNWGCPNCGHTMMHDAYVCDNCGYTRDSLEDDMDLEDDDFFYDREFSTKTREKLAKTGAAMKGGGYPIENEGDLKNAIRAIGRAKNPAATKAHIKKRARALGLSKLLPENWDAAPRWGSEEIRDAWETIDAGTSGSQRGEPVMQKFTLDGVPVEMDDVGAAVVQAHIKKLSQTIVDQQEIIDKKKKMEEEGDDETAEAMDALTKAVDAKDGTIKALEKQLADAKITPAKLNKMVQDRMSVITGARLLLGDKKVSMDDERESIEIQRAALAKTFSEDELKDMSDAGIDAAFQATVRPLLKDGKKASTHDANSGLKEALSRPGPGTGGIIVDGDELQSRRGVSLEEARQLRDAALADLEKRSQNAWRDGPINKRPPTE